MDSCKRVLHLRTVTGRGGGPEKTILNSPRWIGPGYDMRLVYFRPRRDPEYDLPARAQALGVELFDIPESGPVDPFALRQLKQVIRAFQPDILHAHDYKTNLLAVMFRRLSRAAAMTTMHGNGVWGPRLSLYYRIDQWTLPRLDHVVTVSRDVQQSVLTLGVPSSRCSLIYNGIDTDQFQRRQDKEAVKRSLNVPSGPVIIGAVGRLSQEKGFDVLIHAAHRLLEKGHELHLLIVGEGPERETLTKLISELRCQDRVRLLGHRSDVIELFHCMDIFVLSSRREALPNVVLEAMSMDVPVIATRVAGVPDVIQDQENGLLVTVDDPASLTDALERLISDPSLRQRLSTAARSTVEQRFSFRERMNRMREIYERVLDARR